MSDTGDTVTLAAADGHELQAFLAKAKGPSRGGLVILQEIFGVTEQLKDCARSFAAEGFDTLVPALFDRIAPKTVVPFENIEDARSLSARLDAGAILQDIAAARNHFNAATPVSVMGFCWGGGLAVAAAAAVPLAGAISYYGTRLTEHLLNEPRCPLLFHFGETDPYTPPDVVASVRASVPDAEVYLYAAGHAFANQARSSVYQPEAAEMARDRSIAFLKRHHAVH